MTWKEGERKGERGQDILGREMWNGSWQREHWLKEEEGVGDADCVSTHWMRNTWFCLIWR